jgi:prepilin-type N-terminal cleavage/methylation domain-containing protein
MKTQRGVTLVEMLCVVSISAILLTLATPSWRRQRAETAVVAAAGQTLAGLALARRSALASGHTVTLCLTRNLQTCDLSGREWMLFVNAAGGSLAQREAGEQVSRRWPLPDQVRVGGTRGYAYYLPYPRAAATVTFHFCHPAWPDAGRSVIVSQTGRPRVVQPHDSGRSGTTCAE